MDVEELRDYCLSLPFATEDTVFGEDILLIRVFDKIFACLSLVDCDYLAVKCEPQLAVELREKYHDVAPAYHWNKRHWNQLNLKGQISDEFVRAQIRHSYAQVVKKFSKRIKTEYPAITEIE